MFPEHGFPSAVFAPPVRDRSRPQHPRRLLLVERHRTLELWRPDARADLRRVDTRVPEQRADLLEIVVLRQDLHYPRIIHARVP